MFRSIHARIAAAALLALAIGLSGTPAGAQGTAFTYQGKLTDGGSPANGQFDFEFKLFDSSSGGAQLGLLFIVPGVTVSAGTFTVPVDFGVCSTCFTGAARFLEIAVKPSGGGSFTTLSPRQPITSAPYAIKSASAGAADGLSVTCVNCITSSQVGSVSGSAVTGAIPVASVPSGSASYIQNRTSAQSASNFNISGNGVVGGSIGVGTATPTASLDVVDSASQMRFGSTASDSGGFLVSTAASQANLAGGAKWNGAAWVAKSTAASQMDQISGAFRFYTDSGLTAGATFSPTEQMRINSVGNVGLGTPSPARHLHIKGAGDQEIGLESSDANGIQWTLQSSRGTSNGRFEIIDRTANFSRFSILDDGSVGIGTAAPAARLDIATNGGHVLMGGVGCNTPYTGVTFGTTSPTCTNYSLLGAFGETFVNATRPTSANAAGIHFNLSNVEVMHVGTTDLVGVDAELFLDTGTEIRLGSLFGGGNGILCYFDDSQNNGGFTINGCASSRRYKENIEPWTSGLNLVRQLQPVTFHWKRNGTLDVGLIAEDVAAVEPLLVTHNGAGEVEGVKYEKIGVVLVNAVKEQQVEIERQQAQIKWLQNEIDLLRAAVCASNAHAPTCEFR